MGLLMLMVVVLGQEDLSPPPPPPPVEDARVPLDVPPPPPAPAPAGDAQVEQQPPDDGGPGFGARVATSFGIGALAAGATAAGFYFVAGCSSTTGSDCVLLGMAVTTLGFAGLIAGAYGGHRLMGGRSNLGWTFLGGGVGALIGVTAFILGGSTTRSTFSGRTLAWGSALTAGLVGAIGAAFMLEVGHALMVREHPVAVAPMFVPGGAGLAVGGAF